MTPNNSMYAGQCPFTIAQEHTTKTQVQKVLIKYSLAIPWTLNILGIPRYKVVIDNKGEEPLQWAGLCLKD